MNSDWIPDLAPSHHSVTVDVLQMLPLSTSIAILQQCAAGMHHLHSLGIIHRDFRAANILVAGERPLHVVVADFGVSHQLRVYAQVGILNETLTA